MIAPGGTIGILGGGQLGRMMAIAAAQLGYRTHVYAPEENPCGGDVAAEVTRGEWTDNAALGRFADAVDVATFEFENVDAGALAYLAEHVRLSPPARALEVAQDRLAEKRFVADLGGRTAPFAPVDSPDDLARAMVDIGAPGILKTVRFGYDGKGQIRIADGDDPAAIWAEMNGAPSIYEGFVDFAAEFSVIVARTAEGATRVYPVPENRHEDGILAHSLLPPPDVVTRQSDEAIALAETVAAKLDYVGVLTLEFFAGPDGPVFNEMAPRVHNSGHWTIEGAATSQFENHIRAICGLPLGATRMTGTRVEMHNLLGNIEGHAALSDPDVHLHLYGKGEPRPGRKMGHVTRVIV